MGMNTTKINITNLSQHQPPLNEYQLISSGPNFYLWHNNLLRTSLIQYPFTIVNQTVLQDHIQSYLWRHRHYLFVSTEYFKENEEEGKYSIFYERVFTNLSRIKDLTFEDSFQFYYVGLKGFQLLYQKFGYFEVQEEMFHITQNNKVKVWCDRNISRIYPAAQGAGSQQAMVRKIISIVDSNTDATKMKIPIGALLQNEPFLNFQRAMQKFRSLCKIHDLFVPHHLKCLQTLYIGKIQKVVDEFATKQPSENHQQTISRTSTPKQKNLNLNKEEVKPQTGPINNYNMHIPIQQYPSREVSKPYYSLPKSMTATFNPQIRSVSSIPNGVTKIVKIPMKSPIPIQIIKSKSLQIPRRQASYRYFQRPTLAINKEFNKIQTPNNFIMKTSNTRININSNEKLKKSMTNLTQPHQSMPNIQENCNYYKRSLMIQQPKNQLSSNRTKRGGQLKKSSKVNFKLVNPINQPTQQMVPKIANTFQQKITINITPNHQPHVNIPQKQPMIPHEIANKIQNKKINVQDKEQYHQRAETLTSLSQLEKKCNLLQERLTKNAIKRQQPFSPFKQILIMQKDEQSEVPQITIHKPAQESSSQNSLGEYSKREQGLMNLSRQLRQEMNLGHNLKTISTIQSHKILPSPTKVQSYEYILEIQQHPIQNQEKVLQRYPKIEPKLEQPKKQYNPQIDDDIWKDMLKIKSKNQQI